MEYTLSKKIDEAKPFSAEEAGSVIDVDFVLLRLDAAAEPGTDSLEGAAAITIRYLQGTIRDRERQYESSLDVRAMDDSGKDLLVSGTSEAIEYLYNRLARAGYELQHQLAELHAALNPDGSLMEHSQMVQMAQDGMVALEHSEEYEDLERQLAEAWKDTERLDWLFGGNCDTKTLERIWTHTSGSNEAREAIDAVKGGRAMKLLSEWIAVFVFCAALVYSELVHLGMIH